MLLSESNKLMVCLGNFIWNRTRGFLKGELAPTTKSFSICSTSWVRGSTNLAVAAGIWLKIPITVAMAFSVSSFRENAANTTIFVNIMCST